MNPIKAALSRLHDLLHSRPPLKWLAAAFGAAMTANSELGLVDAGDLKTWLTIGGAALLILCPSLLPAGKTYAPGAAGDLVREGEEAARRLGPLERRLLGKPEDAAG
jgi:hypothetical protein